LLAFEFVRCKLLADQEKKEIAVKLLAGATLSAALLASGAASQAETLRCGGSVASEGDSKLSVQYKCGEPVLKDSFCAPVYYGPYRYPVPEPFASTVVPCQPIEEWLYDRGPGNLMAKVRFRSGVVQSISYSRLPE
jgi:hypothetical protein